MQGLRVFQICRALVLLFFLSAAATPLQAQPAALVRDINTVPGYSGVDSAPARLFAAGDKVFFTAQEPGTGSEVWVSDGTPAGTRLLRDLEPGEQSRTITFLGALRGRALWAVRQTFSSQLWSSDGSRQGTVLLYGAEDRRFIADPGRFAFAGGSLYFLACEVSCQLWRSDGTPSGTRKVEGPGVLERAGTLAGAGGRLFFLASVPGDPYRTEVWTTDGTAAGTRLAATLERHPRLITPAGDRIYFLLGGQEGEELWVSDGTPAGTRRLSRFDPPAPFGDNAWLRPSGNSVWFLANDGKSGAELWTSNGTPAGTRRITGFPDPGPFAFGLSPSHLAITAGKAVLLTRQDDWTDEIWAASGPSAMTRLNVEVNRDDNLVEARGKVFFTGSNGRYCGPWVSDGTPAGTRPVSDDRRIDCSNPYLAALGDTVYFESGQMLWQTDGTAAGTRRLMEPPFALASLQIAVAGGKVFAPAETPYGRELWVRDASGQGRTVTDIVRWNPGSQPDELVPLGDRLFFTAYDGTRRSLWQTSPAGDDAVQVLAIEDFDGNRGERLGLSAAGNAVFFFYDGGDGVQLWKTDGTAAGTVQVSRFEQEEPYFSRQSVAFQGKLVFPVSQPVPEGWEVHLWQSDGTTAGTRLLVDVPGRTTQIDNLTALGNELYFQAAGPGYFGVWRSDGTPAGTREIVQVILGDNDRDPHFTRVGNTVYFVALSGQQVWKTDGTAGGTARILDAGFGPGTYVPIDLAEHHGALYILTQTQDTSFKLLRHEGTAAGVTEIRSFPRPPRGIYDTPLSLVSAAGRLFFTMGDPEHGMELWTSDGTPGGTAQLKDIAAGPGSSLLRHLTPAGDRLLFVAHDGVHGFELWQSDGTEAETRLVQDIAPEALSSFPQQLTLAGSRLFFTADDRETGREVWMLPLAGPAGCQPSGTVLCLAGGRFRVTARWRDFQDNTGTGKAVALTADTGYFWFFDAANVEVVLKVLDGRGLNGHFWVFYGALSSVEYTLEVTDTWTGLTRRYLNPAGQLASVGDTHGFGPLGAYSRTGPGTAAASPLPLVAERIDPAAATGSCQASAGRLCLNGGRFAVEASWKDFQGKTGRGTAVPLTGDTGYFWFFDSANVEVVLKVLDGTPLNGKHWVFYGALSNVEYTLTVTDTRTGKVRTYRNPSGRFASTADTGAF